MNLTKLTFLFLSFVLQGCIGNDDFEIPNTEFEDPNIPQSKITDIDAVKGLYFQNMAITQIQSEMYMEGYVISSDAGGNFFKQLILQDKPENPTCGIVIEIDLNPLYTYFDIGRKVYVKLQGLYVGLENGVVKLGKSENNGIARISFSELDNYILRTPTIANITPKDLNITQFSEEFENTFVRLSNVQFNRFEISEENPKTFASEDGDQFDGERVLESCLTNSATILSTSTFSNFKSLKLPSGKGTVDGILTRDFYDDFYTIYLNTPEDINFNTTERCDPVNIPFSSNIDCDNLGNNSDLIFSENFDRFNNITQLINAGWSNISLIPSNTQYTLARFSGNTYVQITGYNSSDANIDNWLVSPPIDLSDVEEFQLNLQIQSSYDNGKIMSVLISNDFDGTVENSTWNTLADAIIPSGPANSFGEFIDVGPINLSCFNSNQLFIAIRYQGSDPSGTTRYHIDNIEVRGK
ncbi:DUF5689 domain-containing protein [Aegicerativicinus sediminis]